MRTWIVAALILAAPGAGFAQKNGKGKAGAAPAPAKSGAFDFANEDQKVLYALGVAMGLNITNFDLTPAETPIVLTGLQDFLAGRQPLVEMPVYGPKIAELENARATARLEARKKKNAAFLEAAAKEEGAVRLPSGVIYKEITPGTGPSPTDKDRVKAHYRGTLIDGTPFDSSYDRGRPYLANLDGGTISCWKQGIPRIKVGGKAKLVCPAETAYGNEPKPPRIPGNSVLAFEIELVEIVPPDPQ